ncbi:MAG: cation:proton antiporter [Corallococcus sp.]|nr:cation:proton antiporter [Corallococcus sp.]
MEFINAVLAIGIALVFGLLSTRLMKLIGLPNVTGYLIVGLIIGPHCLKLINEGVYSSLKVISSIALGFIAFSIGVEFKISHIKEIGKSAIVITLFQALTATLFVDLILLLVVKSYEALILGAIATATAPAATLMVVRQYKAKGIVTGTLLPVVALDDAVGLMVFAISNAIALSLASGAELTAMNLAVWPLVEIITSLAIGALVGGLMAVVPRFFKSRDNRLIASVTCVFLCIGICELFTELNNKALVPFALSDLLVCMMAGAIFVNLRKEAEQVMQGVDRFTPAIFMLFFILSGAELDVTKLGDGMILLALALYLVARSLGKYLGTFAGAAITKSDKKVRNYLGITLFPQAGVAIGMATMCKNEFQEAASKAATPELANELLSVGNNIVTITMCAVLVYELVGPLLTKWALTRAGEIDRSMLRSGRKNKLQAATAGETVNVIDAVPEQSAITQNDDEKNQNADISPDADKK